jgi:hypothetical protein
VNYRDDVCERVRRFNEDEAVWDDFQTRRTLRRLRRSAYTFAEDILDQLDWAVAERECCEVSALGFRVQ